MSITLNVGQTLPLSIRYLDQDGNDMATPPVPDSPPAWSQSNSAADTLTPSSDGSTASLVGVGAGEDSISLSLVVDGHDFSASLVVEVQAVAPPPPPAQVLTSVQIVPGTPE